MLEMVQSYAVKQALKFIEREPEKNLPKLLEWADTFDQNNLFLSQRKVFHDVLDHPEGNWYQLIMKVFELDENVRKTFLENFIVNASLVGMAKQQETAKRECCNVPWAILLDPTSACNLHCTGCWAAEYGNRLNLDLDTLNRIILQGKELGVYMYIYTGGEPMVRKHDLIKLCEMHQDCEFLAFTNGTLIDEAFFDMMIDAGALFVWFFHYMPVGKGAVTQLLPTPQQRAEVYHRIRKFRKTKPIFSMDFQNDAEYVGGCIAGGRSYLHINAKGDVEPCVFIHYSNVNIHDCTLDCTLLEALKSPLFMAYHDGQPFNKNMLQPCPMLENPECLRKMVQRTGAKSTDYESPEDVDTLCDRTMPYAEHWAPTAESLWDESQHDAEKEEFEYANTNSNNSL